MKWFAIIFIAIIIEGITEYLKTAVPKLAEKTWVLLLITAGLGVGSAIAFNADLFAIVGIPSDVPYIGNVFTGILVGRGSNYIYDLIGKYTEAGKVAAEAETVYTKPLYDAEHELVVENEITTAD